MGQRYYWHNVTKDIWNENDLQEFVESCEVGDVIKFTDRGNAIIQDLKTLKDDDFKEYGYVRDNFINTFKEYHEEDFF